MRENIEEARGITLAGLNERLMKYNKGLFFGKWRLDGKTPDEALLGRGS